MYEHSLVVVGEKETLKHESHHISDLKSYLSVTSIQTKAPSSASVALQNELGWSDCVEYQKKRRHDCGVIHASMVKLRFVYECWCWYMLSLTF